MTDNLIEIIGQNIITKCDMTDAKTSENYWIVMKMFSDAIDIQLKTAFELGLLKPINPQSQNAI